MTIINIASGAKGASTLWVYMSSLSVTPTKYFFQQKDYMAQQITNSTHNKGIQKGHTDTALNDNNTRFVKLSWAYPGAPLTLNGAPGKIQGNWQLWQTSKAFAWITYSKIYSWNKKLLHPGMRHLLAIIHILSACEV